MVASEFYLRFNVAWLLANICFFLILFSIFHLFDLEKFVRKIVNIYFSTRYVYILLYIVVGYL